MLIWEIKILATGIPLYILVFFSLQKSFFLPEFFIATSLANHVVEQDILCVESFSITMKKLLPVCMFRYPTDPADRIWSVEANLGRSNILRSSDISLHGAISSIPIEVLKTAASDAKRLLYLHTDLDTSYDNYLIILYFLELDSNMQTGQRLFDVYVNGDKMFENFDILRNGSISNYQEISVRVRSNGYLNISLVKSSPGVKYGPICNAYEIFQVHQKAAETLQRDCMYLFDFSLSVSYFLFFCLLQLAWL